MAEHLNFFLHPKYTCADRLTTDNLQFSSNLQEFSIKLDIICSLETGGQIKTEEAYRQIKRLCEGLNFIHKQNY